MKAVQFFTDGSDPKIVDCEKPTPKPDQVLVRVVASAIDTGVKEVTEKGTFGRFLHSYTNPLFLGWHYSGVVEAKGDEVSDVNVGDSVFGFLQYEPSQVQGSFAEYIVVQYKECALKPSNISHQTAAASATEFLTALQAMRDRGNLAANKSILIIGSGGIGSAAVFIAKNLGANVTAVCSTRDVEKMKKLGADVVIDRKQTDFLTLSDLFDVVFDTPCAYGANQCLHLLKKRGTYVTTLMNWGFFIGMFLALFTSKSVKMVSCNSTRKDLVLLGEWLENGLEIEVDSTFPVKDMKKAYERQKMKGKSGRVVIEVEGQWD